MNDKIIAPLGNEHKRKHTLALFYYENGYAKKSMKYLTSGDFKEKGKTVCNKYSRLWDYIGKDEFNRLKKIHVSK